MIYFGENNDYILCECEICKGEMYIERNNIAEYDAYSFHLYSPVKCKCGAIDEYINRAKKSCHRIRQELSSLFDLLRKQQTVTNKISDITSELNKKYEPPSFLQMIGSDILFSLKIFLILLGAALGVEVFLFIITALMFAIGLFLNMPDLSRAGNELFYNINIFKDQGWAFLSKFNPSADLNIGNPFPFDLASQKILFYYIPSAVAGILIIVFYAFLAVFLVRALITISKITIFASKVVNLRIKINQKKEEYRKHLDDLSIIYQNITEQINESTILPADYKNIRAADAIFRYFINNRVDTIREAINLFHEDDFKYKMLEFNKGVYSEMKQTRRYTKAMYMMTSDENIKVDVKDIKEEVSVNENEKVAEMLKDAFSKIKKSSKTSRLPAPSAVPVKSTENKPESTEEKQTAATVTEDKDKEDKPDIIENSEEIIIPSNTVNPPNIDIDIGMGFFERFNDENKTEENIVDEVNAYENMFDEKQDETKDEKNDINDINDADKMDKEDISAIFDSKD